MRPAPPGGRGRPQLPGPVGERAAVCGQDAAVGVVQEEPAEAGFEGLGGHSASGFRLPFLQRRLLPPVPNANSPLQNCSLEQREVSQLAAPRGLRCTGTCGGTATGWVGVPRSQAMDGGPYPRGSQAPPTGEW